MHVVGVVDSNKSLNHGFREGWRAPIELEEYTQLLQTPYNIDSKLVIFTISIEIPIASTESYSYFVCTPNKHQFYG